MSLTYGELCAGYGGLALGVQSVLGGETAWVSEFDPHPSRILAHRFPHAPNLGDMTQIDWTKTPRVDVLTGGTPCQDLSHAGKRAGMTDGTRSNLWVQMREAIHVLRPRLVCWENVRGAYSASADSALEHCAGCMGERRPELVLRALGRVLGDLSDLGYVGGWYGLRAADVGAAHGRFRVFVLATRRHSGGLGGLEALEHDGRSQATRHGRGVPDDPNRDALRTRSDGTLTLLPTPACNDMGEGKTVEGWDEWTAKMQVAHGNGNGHGKSLAIEALRLLPTPTTADSKASGAAGYGGNEFCTLTDATVRQPQRWGEYEAAIRRHEAAFGRTAPAPTEPTGKNGAARLSPRFVEWLMMLPDGWVTDPAIWAGMTDKRGRELTGDRLTSAARNAQLKALGNGVVPAQAAAATRMFLTDLPTILTHARKAAS